MRKGDAEYEESGRYTNGRTPRRDASRRIVGYGTIALQLICATLVLPLVMMSCSEPTRTSFLVEPEHRLHSLEVNHPAVNLALVAPYDTVTLRAIARNVLNDPLPDTISVTLSTTATQVAVTPTGLVRALAQTSASGITVTLSATYRGVTRTAEARIVVTNIATPPRMDSFSFGRAFTDTLEVRPSTGLGKPEISILPVAKTDSGVAIPRVVVAYQSSNPLAVRVVGVSTAVWFAWPGGVSPSIGTEATGTAIIRAKARVYGVTLSDSVVAKVHYVGNFASVFLFDTMTALPPEIELYRGGDVYWINSSSRNAIGITFDDPDNVKAPSTETQAALLLGWWRPDSGNIAPFMRDTVVTPGDEIPLLAHKSMVRGRSFPEPGRYHWRTTRSPLVEGTIVVR